MMVEIDDVASMDDVEGDDEAEEEPEEEEEEEEEEDEDYAFPIGPLPQTVTNDLKSLDEMVRKKFYFRPKGKKDLSIAIAGEK